MSRLLTVPEIAERLHTNRTYVYKLLKSGELPYLVIGSKKVREDALKEFLEKYDGYDLSDPTNIRRI